MQPLTTDQLRQTFLEFFRRKDHAIIPGASLIPENDPTVLFTTAGMHPLVPYLMGERHPAGKRLADVQRCVRTQDIDEVGDASHLTMFEMLGNWSLGDYFKEGAITMSFEFLTNVLELPLEKLAVSCFEGDGDAFRDTESAEIWKRVGIREDRIGFLPKAKNWWGPAGRIGPCGPDTEMFYWVGPAALPPPGSNPANDEVHWLEIWNDVFMQYNKKGDGTFEPLTQKNVDTGMGLERVAMVLQGVESVYDTDRMRPILEKVRSLDTGMNSEAKQSLIRYAHIITDHMRASVSMVADGVHPSNVDRGYVLRKLIRRSVRSARKLMSVQRSWTADIVREVVAQYGGFYPHLAAKQEDIISVIRQEEDQFQKTLEIGSRHLSKELQKISGGGTLPGIVVFHLYDTYGFPPELTKDIASEWGVGIEENGFKIAFEEHQAASRAGAEKRFAGGLADHSVETTKLHTATHLLNAALRRVLGPHVGQKGSNITAERLRFDFNHSEKMTLQQIEEVERLVNEAIAADLPVSYHVTTVEGAKVEGAIGVFDERYGTEVKVYRIGPSTSSGRGEWSERPFSLEICGGPHVARTGMLGVFKIQKEESSSSGIRRIKAVVQNGPPDIEVAKGAR